MSSMRIGFEQLGLPLCFLLLSASASENQTISAPVDVPQLVSLCDLDGHPSNYAGKTIMMTVHVAPFKDRTRLWSPACSNVGTVPYIDREATSENGIADIRETLYKSRPFLATLTGVYDTDHFDPVRNRKYPVFRVVAAKN